MQFLSDQSVVIYIDTAFGCLFLLLNNNKKSSYIKSQLPAGRGSY